jgi:hypothetical protein
LQHFLQNRLILVDGIPVGRRRESENNNGLALCEILTRKALVLINTHWVLAEQCSIDSRKSLFANSTAHNAITSSVDIRLFV